MDKKTAKKRLKDAGWTPSGDGFIDHEQGGEYDIDDALEMVRARALNRSAGQAFADLVDEYPDLAKAPLEHLERMKLLADLVDQTGRWELNVRFDR